MGKVTKEILSNDTGKEIKKSIDNLRDTVVAASSAKYDKTATLLEVTDARENFQSLGQNVKQKPYYFNNVADMKAANLNVENYVITKGYNNINDGGGAEYVITNEASETEKQEALNNGLYATLKKYDDIYIDDIEFNSYFDDTTRTNYYVIHIPHLDSKGNIIKLKRGFAKDAQRDPIANETISEFAQRHNATLITTGGIFLNNIDPSDPDYLKMPFVVIHNGEVISRATALPGTYQTDPNKRGILGIKTNGALKWYTYDTSVEDLLNDGVVDTISTFNQVMRNGELITQDQTINVNTYQYQYILLGQNTETLDYYYICCDGKGKAINPGMTVASLCNILKDNYNVTEIYRLDSGGSTEIYYKGSIRNQISENDNLSERQLPDYIYFEKDLHSNINNQLFSIYEEIGKVREEINIIKNNPIIYDRGYKLEYGERNNYNSAISQLIGNKRMSLFLDPPGTPGGFTIFDSETQKNILKVTASGEIITQMFNLNDTGWLDASTTDAEPLTIKYRRIGDMLFIKGRVSDISATTKFYMDSSIVNVSTANYSYACLCPASGSTYAKVTVIANRVEVIPGNYSGTIAISCNFIIT